MEYFLLLHFLNKSPHLFRKYNKEGDLFAGFIKKLFSLRDENSNNDIADQNVKNFDYTNIKISHILEDNLKIIQYIFEGCSDLIIRKIKITNNPEYTAALIYFENMTQLNLMEETIIEKLTNYSRDSSYRPDKLEYCKYLLGIRDNDIYTYANDIANSILSGNAVLLIDGLDKAMVINSNNPPSRAVEEPNVESVVRGPREGFTESISTNIALIRKRIKTPHLKTETFIVGRQTKTKVTIAYISNIANEKTVKEVKERISRIDIDSVIGISYIKEYIEDAPLSGFPTVFSTERPDVAASKILDGRVAIITDGNPLVKTVPAVFMEFLNTNEDYYIKYIPATLNRWIRYLSFLLTLTLPGTFIAITTFHQELIPTPLLISFIKSRSDLPYSALLECIMMLIAYEILREAGVRMPRAVGQAISVVGALVLGQAAVEAGLVSTPMVIVIATTAISSFAVPNTDMYEAIRLPRFIFILLGGFLGLLGLICGFTILIIELISIRSFGVPYMEPIAPAIKGEFWDTLVRRPIWTKFTRPWFITGRRSIRRKQKPYIKSIKEDQKNDMNKRRKNEE